MTNAYNPGSQFRQRSPYGDRIDPLTRKKIEFHAGQDFGAPKGTPIPAATSGVVVYSGPNEGFGNLVVVKNDAGGYSLYGHMQDGGRAELGRRIWQGDTLGLVGSTGRSTGPHLHYSVIRGKAGKIIERRATSRAMVARSASS
jgi:murein DD-endopeptidase MepM/ murein hydrolase activator NlpD